MMGTGSTTIRGSPAGSQCSRTVRFASLPRQLGGFQLIAQLVTEAIKLAAQRPQLGILPLDTGVEAIEDRNQHRTVVADVGRRTLDFAQDARSRVITNRYRD